MSLDIGLRITIDVGSSEPYDVELYDANYTHNVTPMWGEAGVFDVLYGREEWADDQRTAAMAIPVLEAGLKRMQDDPEVYSAMNPSNGWGSYEGALVFLSKLLEACRQYPKATFWRWA